MFWNTERKIKTELMTPLNLSMPAPQIAPAVAAQTEAKEVRTDTDLALKLTACGALGSQAALAIYGYSLLVGYYEQFGIDINELALGTPTLLLHGYINILSGALTAANRLPVLGPGLLALTFVGAAWIFISLITKHLKAGVIVGLAAWSGISMFVAFFAPAVGVQLGAKTGLEDFEKYTSIASPDGLENLHSIITDKGQRLTGHMILADSKSTFLLVGMRVFKIDSPTGRVVRETQLSLKASRPTAN